MQLSEQELVRREKLSKLRALGINPYPADLFPVNHTSKQIKSNYEEGKKFMCNISISPRFFFTMPPNFGWHNNQHTEHN